MKLLTLGFSILNSTYLEAALEHRYRSLLYAGALSWFEESPTWSYGSDRLQLQEDMLAIQRLITVVNQDVPHPATHLSSRDHATMSLTSACIPWFGKLTLTTIALSRRQRFQDTESQAAATVTVDSPGKRVAKTRSLDQSACGCQEGC
jgi:hypothetical protein